MKKNKMVVEKNKEFVAIKKGRAFSLTSFFRRPSTSKKNSTPSPKNSPASGANRARILAEIREENDWKTDLVLGKKAGAALR